MKYIKFNLTFLIIFIGLNYIYFNFGKNKFNFQIESFLKENLKKAFLDYVVFVDEKPMIDSDNLIKEYRENWLKNGAKWFAEKRMPKNWKLEEQLKNLTMLEKSEEKYE